MRKKNKVFVLGATSFIGFSLLKLNINKKYWTGGISKKFKNYKKKIIKKRLNYISKKVKFFNFFKKKSFSNIDNHNVLINCIGFTKDYNNEKFNIIEAKKKFDIYYKNLKQYIEGNDIDLIIHIGSSSEYGQTKYKINEKSKCFPNTKYGKYKCYEFNKIKQLAKQQIKIVNIRCFSIFGKLNKSDSLFEEIKNNKTIIVKNPNNKIDIISVTYLSKLINKIIISKSRLKKIEIFNFCSGNGLRIKELLINFNLNKNIIFDKSNKRSVDLKTSNKKMVSYIKFEKKQNLQILKNYLN